MSPASVEISCINCPSYISPEIYAGTIGKSTGMAACKTKQIALGMPDLRPTERSAQLKATAKACPSYMADPAPVSVTRKLPIFVAEFDKPDASELRQSQSKRSELDRNAQSVNSCNACVFHVAARTMSDEHSISAGLCRANNCLVPTNAAGDFAAQCGYKEFSIVKPTIDEPFRELNGFEFGSWLQDTAADIYASGDVVLASVDNIIEPSEYLTDDDVTDEERAKGIRAWRKITDPDNESRHTMIPVFDREFFTADEQIKIPVTGSDEHPELYVDYSESVYTAVTCWLELDETPTVWGEPGVGKTELFRHIAWLMQLPFERISVTASSEIDDIAGKMMFTQEKGTFFQYGRIPFAWSKPCVIVIDEPNVGPAEVWHFIRPLTDNSKQLVLDQNRGETIKRHDHAFLGMAMNPSWDPRNVGTETIADADSSRIMHIFIDLPPEEVEMKIIADRVAIDGWKLSNQHMRQLMTIAGDIRKLSHDGSIPISWGIRHQLKVARALKFFSPVKAYRLAAADFLEPDAQQAVLDLVRVNMPKDAF